MPELAPGRSSSSVFLVEVPGRDGQVLVVALLVLPGESPGADVPEDPDAIVEEVLAAIDWEPYRRLPPW